MRGSVFLVLLGAMLETPARAQGTGEPQINMSDASFGLVGSGEAAIRYIAIANATPNTPLVVSAAALSGDVDSWFSFAGAGCDRVSTCPFTPALSITTPASQLAVRCAPPAGSSGTRSANLMVTSNAASGTGVAALSCTAGGDAIAVSPASHVVDFGLVNLRGASASSVVRISNPGGHPVTTGAATIGGADAAQFTVTSATPATIPPGGQIDITITYTPIAERPRTDPDTANLAISIDSSIGPGEVNIAVRGHGGAAHASLASLPTFADSFTNPGPAAQVLPIVVANTGEAVLALSNATLTEAPTWKLMNPDPVEVPGGTSYSFLARFSPTEPGPAPPTTFSVDTTDVSNPSLSATLTGNGVRRNVVAVAPVVDLYYAGVGSTARLSEGHRGDLLKIQNVDATHIFEVREIRVTDGEGAFVVLDSSNIRLAATATRGFDVAFTPPHAGEFEATASVFLDADPVAQTTVTLRGRGVAVEVNGGGCAATQGAGLGLIAAIAALFRRRRALGPGDD